MKWELVQDNEFAGYMRRTKVPWGWIVAYVEDVIHDTPIHGMVGGWDWRTSITFVFDPFHWWKPERGDK